MASRDHALLALADRPPPRALMDLRALRTDVSVVAKAAGFNAWSYEPDDPQDLPAAIVGSLRSLERLTATVCQLELEITFYVNTGSGAEDAAERLDLVLSFGMQGSFMSWMEGVSAQQDRPAWRSATFISASSYFHVSMPGGGTALACTLVYQFTA